MMIFLLIYHFHFYLYNVFWIEIYTVLDGKILVWASNANSSLKRLFFDLFPT
jgi:hypothetical protein